MAGEYIPGPLADSSAQRVPVGFRFILKSAIEKFFQNSSTERKKRRLAGRSGILKEFRAGANDALRARGGKEEIHSHWV
jgi:hypothetical protein